MGGDEAVQSFFSDQPALKHSFPFGFLATLGRNYMGHNNMGHHYIGHNYIGHSNVGHI